MAVVMWLVVLAVVLVTAFYLFSSKQRIPPGLKEIPSPPSYPIVGHLSLFTGGEFSLEKLAQIVREYGNVVRFNLFGVTFIHVNRPEYVKFLLSDGFNQGVFKKGERFIEQQKDFLGKGIFASNDEDWKNQRTHASVLFKTDKLRTFVSVFEKYAVKLIEKLEKLSTSEDAKKGINMQDYCSRYTLSSFCEIGFGVDVKAIEQETNDFAVAFDFVQTFTSRRGRFGKIWPIIEKIRPPTQFQKHLSYMNNFVYDIIKQRKSESMSELETREDLLSQLIVRQRNNSTEDDEELRDFVMNFLIAGRDTTAVLLTFSLFEIARREDIKAKLCEEMEKVVSVEGITWDSVKKLSYMKQFLQEVLRLYPPVPVDGFTAVQDTVLPGNYFVPNSAVVLYNNWAMHRTKEFWGENAEVFDPAHFDKPPESFTFNPFHGGPRLCLGQEMAYEEAKIFLCKFLKHFDMKLNANCDESLKNAIMLTFKNGLLLDLFPK